MNIAGSAANIAGEGSHKRPYQRLGEHVAKGIAQAAVRAHAHERAEIGAPDPGKQLAGHQMIAVIICKGDEDHDDQGDDGKAHRADDGHAQQRTVEL